MPEFLSGLFQTDFLPHGWCYRWDPAVVWLHVVSDLLIALAYYFIPFALIYVVRRRADLAFSWMFWLFGLFIFACGTTHLMSVWVVWYPWYRFDGIVKLITALASVPTAILLMRIAPQVIALPSPEDLRVANTRLGAEIEDRKLAEEKVRALNAELEKRVDERTRQLADANRCLAESEYRLQSILNSSPSLIYMKDLEGRFLFANKALADALGLSSADVQGKTDYDIFPRPMAEAYRAADGEVVADKASHDFEELVHLKGRHRTYLSTKFPLCTEAGSVYALCGISTDITERKEAERALKIYSAELEQFTYVASHDLQEPLRTIKSYAQLLSRRFHGQLGNDGDEFLGYIVGGIDRMQTLIADLLAYSELSRTPRAPQEVDITGLFHEAVSNLRAAINEAGAIVTTDPLPVLSVRPIQIQQLFENLLSNAIKYRRDELPRIHLSCSQTDTEWKFTLSDNGMGIEPRYADQIFGLFKRLHGREVPGTGIGLAICKRVVESHRGRIWMTSEPGKGSQFHFTLPNGAPFGSQG
jgi:PAS domain S-box-containing protein